MVGLGGLAVSIGIYLASHDGRPHAVGHLLRESRLSTRSTSALAAATGTARSTYLHEFHRFEGTSEIQRMIIGWAVGGLNVRLPPHLMALMRVVIGAISEASAD